jgi:5-formyltetrahydrofolate cyclo-ligase
MDEKSLAIANEILKLPIWEKTYFHIFLPITEHKEVDTEFILHLLAGKDKEIVISKSDFEYDAFSSDRQYSNQKKRIQHSRTC